MNDVGTVIFGIYNILNMPITVYGYSFTIWQIIILFAIASGVGVIISFFLGGD